jgi:hypothetical protein
VVLLVVLAAVRRIMERVVLQHRGRVALVVMVAELLIILLAVAVAQVALVQMVSTQLQARVMVALV